MNAAKLVLGASLAMVNIEALPATLTTSALYQQFNMRSIYSSYGQRLKYYCQSYPDDFFAVTEETDTTLSLRDGNNEWIFTIDSAKTITLSNRISSGTYNTQETHHLHFDSKHQDWRAGDILIPVPDDCVDYPGPQ